MLKGRERTCAGIAVRRSASSQFTVNGLSRPPETSISPRQAGSSMGPALPARELQILRQGCGSNLTAKPQPARLAEFPSIGASTLAKIIGVPPQVIFSGRSLALLPGGPPQVVCGKRRFDRVSGGPYNRRCSRIFLLLSGLPGPEARDRRQNTFAQRFRVARQGDGRRGLARFAGVCIAEGRR